MNLKMFNLLIFSFVDSLWFRLYPEKLEIPHMIFYNFSSKKVPNLHLILGTILVDGFPFLIAAELSIVRGLLFASSL